MSDQLTEEERKNIAKILVRWQLAKDWVEYMEKKDLLTAEEKEAIARIAVRWHNNSESHTAHQASFDVGYLMGILARFINLTVIPMDNEKGPE